MRLMLCLPLSSTQFHKIHFNHCAPHIYVTAPSFATLWGEKVPWAFKIKFIFIVLAMLSFTENNRSSSDFNEFACGHFKCILSKLQTAHWLSIFQIFWSSQLDQEKLFPLFISVSVYVWVCARTCLKVMADFLKPLV